MSEYKTKIVLGAVLAVIIAIGLTGATLFVVPQTSTANSTLSQQSSTSITQLPSSSSSEITSTSQIASSSQVASTSQEIISTTEQIQSSSSEASAQSALIVQLTDPPIVPTGTTSLNMTYTAIDLLVTVPVATSTSTTSTSSTTQSTSSTSTSSGSTSTTTVKTTTKSSTTSAPVNSENISLTPTGGSATVDLLKLQNISQTIASASLPNGSTIYSVSFVVSGISIDVNGVISPVTLATGGNTLLVALSTPAVVRGTIGVLLDLNPTIISTTTGYEMIPSSVGVILPQAEITPPTQQIGHTQTLTNQDHVQINQLFGKVTAKLLGLSVSGSTTTISVQVSNVGNLSDNILSIGVSGNFTVQNCVTSTTTTTSSDHGHPNPVPPQRCEGANEIVFVPGSPSTTSTTVTSTSKTTSTTTTTTTQSTSSASSGACTSGQMTQQSMLSAWNVKDQLTLSPGQCVILTFSGTISGVQPGNVLVPLTGAGQTYNVEVDASNVPTATQCAQPFGQVMMGCQGNSGNNNQGQQGNNNQGSQGNNGKH